MKIDVSTVMRDFYGKAIELAADDKTPLTMKRVLVDSLMGTYRDEEKLDGFEKFKRFKLASKIEKAEKDVSLTSEEVTELKKLVGKAYNTMVTGTVYEIIEVLEKKS